MQKDEESLKEEAGKEERLKYTEYQNHYNKIKQAQMQGIQEKHQTAVANDQLHSE